MGIFVFVIEVDWLESFHSYWRAGTIIGLGRPQLFRRHMNLPWGTGEGIWYDFLHETVLRHLILEARIL